MANELVKAKKDPAVAYLLLALSLFGVHGLHRFYMGRIASGLLWLLTGGFCFIGTFIDLFFVPRMIEDSERGEGW